MEIHLIGVPQPELAQYAVEKRDQLIPREWPRFGGDLVGFFKYLRGIKKCTVLYVRTGNPELSGTLSPWLRKLAPPLLRAVVKLPRGPAIVVENPDRRGFLASAADIVVTDASRFPDTLDRAYQLADCGHPDSIYNEPIQRIRLDWLKSLAKGSVMEVGCANGYVLAYVGGGVGFDADGARLEVARRKHPSSRFVQGDGCKMPFADAEFDTVMVPDILEHVPYETARLIIKEALRVGKQVLITVPNAEKANYDKALVENPEHLWFPTREKMRDLMGGVPHELTSSQGGDFLLIRRPG